MAELCKLTERCNFDETLPEMLRDRLVCGINNKKKPTAIKNGNRTEWSPIRSVIIRVINKSGLPRSGRSIC